MCEYISTDNFAERYGLGMDQKKLNSESFICKRNFSGEDQTEVTQEYTLPDYFPDIKRILHVFSDVRKTGMYISDDKIEYDGCVNCGVLYRGEDKSLQCAEFKTEFSDVIPLKGVSADVCDVSLCAKNMTLRALTPRKVSLKSKIEAHTDAWSKENVTPNVHGTSDERSIESITQSIIFSDTSVCEETGIGVSEDINITESMPAAQKIIYTYITPHTTEARAEDGKILFRGEFKGAVIYESVGDTNEIHLMPLSIAVSHIIQCEDAKEGSVCIGKINIYDITSTVSENTQGEKRVVEIDFLYDIKVLCNKGESVTAPLDMYAVGHTGRIERKNIKCCKNSSFLKGNFSVNAQLPKEFSENITGDVLMSFGNAQGTSFSMEGGKLVCSGICEVSTVFDGDGEYDSVRSSFPFKGEIDIPDRSFNKAQSVLCNCGDIKLRYDGENYFADTEIYIDSVLCEECSYNVIENITFEKKPNDVKQSVFTLYYPTSDESLWDVAKKYGVSLDFLKSSNGTDDVSAHKNVVIIPKK